MAFNILASFELQEPGLSIQSLAYGLDDPGFEFRQGYETFSLLHNV